MIKDVRHYDVIVSPVITEKATIASENNQFVFKVARNATKPQIKAAIETTVRRQGDGGQHASAQGQEQDVPRRARRQQDVKKAIVTLADGDRIDVTTGL